jgi:hypothetical protein
MKIKIYLLAFFATLSVLYMFVNSKLNNVYL